MSDKEWYSYIIHIGRLIKFASAPPAWQSKCWRRFLIAIQFHLPGFSSRSVTFFHLWQLFAVELVGWRLIGCQSILRWTKAASNVHPASYNATMLQWYVIWQKKNKYKMCQIGKSWIKCAPNYKALPPEWAPANGYDDLENAILSGLSSDQDPFRVEKFAK